MARFDLFTSIHKAVRAMVYHAGGHLQTTDFGDERAAAKAAVDLEAVMVLLHHHHETEEEYVFPQLRPFEPRLVDQMMEEHDEVVRLLEVTSGALEPVRSADPGARVAAGADLNRRFNELIAYYLEHLAHEEATVLPATWEHFDDGQLVAIQGSIIGSMAPERLFQWLAWIFRGLNRMELVGLLAGASRRLPPEALDGVRALGAASMEPAAWAAVRGQVGL